MEDRKIIIEKKIECIIGILFLIPPILGVIAFTLQLFGADLDFSEMSNLSYSWISDWSSNGGGGMSAAPIYLAIMALAGAYMVKDKFRYFIKDQEESPKDTNNEE